MGRKITVILRNGTELIYKNARVVEGNKTWIYQVNKNERPEELLAFLDPNHITKLYTEEDWYLPWPNQQACIGSSLSCFPALANINNAYRFPAVLPAINPLRARKMQSENWPSDKMCQLWSQVRSRKTRQKRVLHPLGALLPLRHVPQTSYYGKIAYWIQTALEPIKIQWWYSLNHSVWSRGSPLTRLPKKDDGHEKMAQDGVWGPRVCTEVLPCRYLSC